MANGGYRFDRATLEAGANLPHGAHRGVTSNDAGEYRCWSCGSRWQRARVWARWPITLMLCRHWQWGHHGVEIGSEGIERLVFARVISLGPLRIIFGRTR